MFNNIFDWLSKDENIRTLRTGSMLFFVGAIVLYAYGFRTGFQFDINDIADLIFDISLFLLSSILVMNEYSIRGEEDALKSDEGQRAKELDAKHTRLMGTVDNDKLAERLVLWNEKEQKNAITRKKRLLAQSLRAKRRNLISKGTKRANRKAKRYEKKIAFYDDPSTQIKAKYEHVRMQDLQKGIQERSGKDKVVGVRYSASKDALQSQSAIVFVSLIITSIVRFSAEPTTENLWALIVFLSILIPFLVLRAVMSYQMARKNLEKKTPHSLTKKIQIIEWAGDANGKNTDETQRRQQTKESK